MGPIANLDITNLWMNSQKTSIRLRQLRTENMLDGRVNTVLYHSEGNKINLIESQYWRWSHFCYLNIPQSHRATHRNSNIS